MTGQSNATLPTSGFTSPFGSPFTGSTFFNGFNNGFATGTNPGFIGFGIGTDRVQHQLRHRVQQLHLHRQPE